MSKQATRLRRVGESRATIRHNLNARDAAMDARHYTPSIRFTR